MINFFLLLKYRYLFNPPLTPFQSSGRLAVQQMEEKRSSDAYNLAAWESWVHNSLQFTLPSSRANSIHPLVMLPNMDPSVVGGKSLLPPELPASLRFSDHFNMVISSFTSRKRTQVPVLISAMSTGWRTRCVWLGRHLGGVSKLSAREQCTQRNDMETDAGRLVPAVLNE